MPNRAPVAASLTSRSKKAMTLRKLDDFSGGAMTGAGGCVSVGLASGVGDFSAINLTRRDGVSTSGGSIKAVESVMKSELVMA